MAKAQVRVQSTAKRGEVVEVKAMAAHPMHTGFRFDGVGQKIPRNIVDTFTCTYAGKEVFRVKLGTGIATNPYFSFYFVAQESGDLDFKWVDDKGEVIIEKATIAVTG